MITPADGLAQQVKRLVNDACGHDDVPADPRAKVLSRIALIRPGQAIPEHLADQDVTTPES
ncbi:hypothetical protein ACFW5D_32635 [Streptomyces sp. NPDC058770]|uniref:hypothetical protein n=1 Tax=Streptomyces sp. NPDC058770 TaxID=3346631 RepID=UPI00368E7FA9